MTISDYDWGGRYVYKPRNGGKEHLSQTLGVINDFTYIRDLFCTGLLLSSGPGDEVLLKTWKKGSPESQLEEYLA